MRIIIAVIALIILGSMGTVAFQTSLEEAGDDTMISNESFTPTADTVIQLENSNQTGAYYNETVVVYDENGTEMTAGTDYDWYTANGTIKPLSGGALAGDSSAIITYRYQKTTESQRGFASMMAQIPGFIGLAAPVFILVMFVAFLRG